MGFCGDCLGSPKRSLAFDFRAGRKMSHLASPTKSLAWTVPLCSVPEEGSAHLQIPALQRAAVPPGKPTFSELALLSHGPREPVSETEPTIR